MALQKLKSQVKAIKDSSTSYEIIQKIVRGLSSPLVQQEFDGKYHFLTIESTKFAKKLHEAVHKAITEHFAGNSKQLARYLSTHASKLSTTTFVDAIDDVAMSFNTPVNIGGHSTRFHSSNLVKNLYKDTHKIDTYLVLTEQNVYTRGKKYRDAVYRQWRKNVGGEKSRVLPKKPDYAKVPGKLDVTHDKNTTVWLAFIEFRVEQIQAELNIKVESYNLIEGILEGLGVNWEEEPIKGVNTDLVGQKRIVKVSLGPDNVRHLLDAGGVHLILDEITTAQWEIFWGGLYYMNPIKALKAIASPSFSQQAAQAAQYALLREMMNKNKKHISSKSIKTKKPKIKPRSSSLKKAKKSPSARKQANIPQRINVSARTEKGTGTTTQGAADLARLKKYINSRLPAEVRRNMGRPALRNRTGRFSNSVQLLSLQQAQNSIMAKYTYLLSPYQTFENTGRKRWPLAYNPKDLIAKSIRNLAQGRIEQKLTVRRV